MISRITIPQAFENMEEATIGAWIKGEGDSVAIGEGLCELITEKTTFDLPAETAGTLRRIVAAEKSIVPVGYIIGLIGADDDEVPDVTAENAAIKERRQTAADASADTTPALSVPTLNVLAAPASAPTAGGSRVRATPAARRAARDRGIAIEDVAAALPGKVLSEDDVNSFRL